MGGRSSSSSSSSSSQSDNRVGASDEAIAIGGEGQLTINYQDQGILDFATDVGGGLIDLAGKALDGALSNADKTAQLGSQTALSGLATVDNAKNGIADDVVKTFVPLGLGVAGLYAITRFMK